MSSLSDVTDATFEQEVVRSSVPVVVDFWAPWCGPCRVMEPVLDELAARATGVRFVKLNVDENIATATRYQVLSLPTLLVLRGGQVEKQLVGALPRRKLEAELAPYLGAAAA